MTYYAQISENNIISASINSKIISDDIQSIEISNSIYNNIIKYGNSYYLYKNGEFVLNPDYEAEQAAKEREARIEEIKTELENIDKQKIRAMTEPDTKDSKTSETWLEYYNKQAKNLREELRTAAEAERLAMSKTAMPLNARSKQQELESLENNESEGINEQ